MWDNRLSKRNPKAPDFKCRDRRCDGAVWPGEHHAARTVLVPPHVVERAPDETPDQDEVPTPTTATSASSAPIATTAGLRALRRVAAEAAARPAASFALRAVPDVVAALQADSEALADLARRTGRPLMLRSDPALPPGSCAPEETHRA